jgi:hypothetical protein
MLAVVLDHLWQSILLSVGAEPLMRGRRAPPFGFG